MAGEDLDEAVAAARAMNQAGRVASLDYFGEGVASKVPARRAADAYLAIFDRIAAGKLDANVSLKLTQLGLDLDARLCQSLIETIAERAADYGNFVRIDMEGSSYTQRTLDLCKCARARRPAVGPPQAAVLPTACDEMEGSEDA